MNITAFPSTTEKNYPNLLATCSVPTGEQLDIVAAKYILENLLKERRWLPPIPYDVSLSATNTIRIGATELHPTSKQLKWALSVDIDNYTKKNRSVIPNGFERMNALCNIGRTDVVGLAETITGEDLRHLLSKMNSLIGLPHRRLFADKTASYPLGVFANNSQSKLSSTPTITIDSTTYHWIKNIYTTDSSGNPSGVLEHYRGKEKIIIIPYSVNQTSKLSVRYEYGLTKNMFGLFNRQQLKENQTASILLTQTPYEADAINLALKQKSISNFIATSWYGASNSLKHSNWSYIQERTVIICIPNMEKKYGKAVRKKLSAVNANTLELRQEWNQTREMILSLSVKKGAVISLLQNTTKHKNHCPETSIPKEAGIAELFHSKIVMSSTLSSQRPSVTRKITWDDMLRSDLLTLVCGPTEVGKTMFLYGLMYAIANKSPFLNIVSRKAQSVLYIDAETAEPEAISRMQRIEKALPNAKNPVNLICTRSSDVPLTFDDEKQRDELSSELEKYDIVVIDNLLSLANKTIRTPRRWEQFAKWCNDLNTAVILVHHENKEGAVLGITEIQALTPTLIQLEKDDSNPNFSGVCQTVCFTKCKADPILSGQKFKLSLEAGNNTPWEVKTEEDSIPVLAPLDSTAELDIAEFTQEELCILKKAINSPNGFKRVDAENWSGTQKTTTLTLLNKLQADNLLEAKGTGKARKYYASSKAISLRST